MTIRNKQALIAEIVALLDKSIDTEVPDTPISKPTNEPTEMLRIKDCTKAFPGLSEYTVRKLVANKKIPYIRSGEGENGKILVYKHGLEEYLTNRKDGKV